jgi:DNA ligase (NAD+)
MDIDGLGEAIVEQLIDADLITTYADLYKLDKEDLIPLERMAEKSAKNLVKAIQNSKQQPLERLIYAIGIRFVGKTVAKDLASNFKSMDALMNASEEAMTQVDSIGPKIAESVKLFFNHEKNIQLIEQLRKAGLNFEMSESDVVSSVLENKKFVLTGSLPSLTRKEATELIEKHGGKTSSSVSSNTDFLLAGESAGSKLNKAQKLGIPVIDEEKFMDMIGE